MYEEFYGLTEPPFSLTPDPKFFYRSEAHNRAFELLQYGFRRREGFMILCGDIGTGKTTLCRTVLDATDDKVYAALLLNPFLSEIDLLKAILKDFGVPSESNEKQQLINSLNEFLISNLESGGRAVVLIDEAQNIPLRTLEQIRILSNLETNKEKLLQIVLVGQLELVDVLAKPELRQLNQRISIKCQLSSLTRDEVADYIRHRLTVAGWKTSNVSFTPDGLRAVYEYSKGIPRLINLIADRSLLAGLALNARTIDRTAVREAVNALQLPRRVKATALREKLSRLRWRPAAVVLGLSFVFALIFVLMMHGLHPAR
jgi:general secretion pathway protein A